LDKPNDQVEFIGMLEEEQRNVMKDAQVEKPSKGGQIKEDVLPLAVQTP
jgi:hypothetical protein